MPPLYGEGKDVALKRLQMTINQFSKNMNVSEGGNSKDEDVPFIVPLNRNLQFTGREDQLAELEGRLFMREQTTRFAITGLGGVGKTQLLLELVYRTRARHRNCTVLWMYAANMESLHQAYQNAAQQLNISGVNNQTADFEKLVQDHLSKESAGQWLLVFDNADDINMWVSQSRSESSSGTLIDCLPRSKQGCIVFTTRDRKTAVKLAQQNVIEVSEMSENVAAQLLEKRLLNPYLVKNGQNTKALLKELTYLPLAIVQAAAYINENRISFADYLSLLAQQEEDIIDLLSEKFEEDGRYPNIKNPIATTWIISFEQIRHRNPLAADYLSFMACIDPKDIPQSLLPVGESRKKETDAIGTLDAYSFIVKRSADLALDLHRLVHLATRNWLRKKQLISQWTETAIARLEEAFQYSKENRNIWRTYLPHARYVLQSDVVNKDEEKRGGLMWSFANCLVRDGQHNEAEALLGDLIKQDKRLLGHEHPDTLTCIIQLAMTYKDQGRWKEAEELNVQVLEVQKRILGHEHPHTLTTMGNLALVYTSQGRWKKAEELNLQVIEARKRVLGHEHPETLTIMNNVAWTQMGNGQGVEALELMEECVAIQTRILGPNHPNILSSSATLLKWRTKEVENGPSVDAGSGLG